MMRSRKTRRFTSARLAAVMGIALFLTAAGTGVGYAAWSTSVASSPTATAGSIASTVTNVGDLGRQYQFSGSTSPLKISTITVRNSGTVPLNYTLAVTTTTPAAPLPLPASSVSFWLWSAPTSTGCGSTTQGAVGTLAVPPAMPASATGVLPATDLYLCAATQFNGTNAAAQGQSAEFSLVVTGRIGTNWTTTASGVSTATQSVYRIGAIATSGTGCVSNSVIGLGSTATFTWTTPAGPPAPTVTVTANLGNTAGTGPASFTVTSPHTFTRTEVKTSTTLTFVVSEPTYGTSSVSVVRNIKPTGGLFGIAAGTECG